MIKQGTRRSYVFMAGTVPPERKWELDSKWGAEKPIKLLPLQHLSFQCHWLAESGEGLKSPSGAVLLRYRNHDHLYYIIKLIVLSVL